ncbi:MAG: FeoA family protein [Oscillospiraceae bacterium]|nr:FeoA family protein [Oscillospiraceae bacterium]
MPLALIGEGEEAMVRRVGGNTEVQHHLENLGFVPGSTVKVITMMGGNLIVQVKEARVAISSEMAQKIMV